MNELEKIKGVEKEVTEKIEKKRQAADASINKIRVKEKEMIRAEVDGVKAKIKKKIEDAEIKAKGEADKIIADGKKRVDDIQKTTSEREEKAIDIIVKGLIGD